MQNSTDAIQTDISLFLYGGLIVFTLLAAFIGFVVFYYRKNQFHHLREKEILQSEILKSRLEIKEQTLQNIAQEIHDNVGQRLTLAALQLQELHCDDNVKLENSIKLVEIALQDLRNLSKSMSGNYILDRGIELALEHEAEMLCSSGIIDCAFSCVGDMHCLTEQQEIVLFRCAQEALTNIVKHAKATFITIHMEQSSQKIALEICDNGIGWDEELRVGVGTLNIRERISMLNGTYSIGPKNGGGTCVQFLIQH